MVKRMMSLSLVFKLLACAITAQLSFAADARRPPEWDKVVEAAKKEGKIVLAIPPSNELRKEMEIALKKFGIEAELVPASGPKNAARIAAEKKAGVSYFDAIICGTGTAVSLAHDGMLEPIESFWILPEVKDPKLWFGGHVWEDNFSTNKFLYSFLADVATQNAWFNATLAKAEDFKSFDDFLQPKWKGKIGFSDPRVPSSGQGIWSFMWDIKGEEFLKKLAGQDLFLTRDLRQLADALAKAKIAVAFGLGRTPVDPYVDAGLPLKPVPAPKEGLPASNGFGVIGVVKNPPNPNAARVFVNWFLSKEGQDWYNKVMENGTRRFDVETRWLAKLGINAAKDSLTVEQYHRVRNHLEDKYTKVRAPAGKFAEMILK